MSRLASENQASMYSRFVAVASIQACNNKTVMNFDGSLGWLEQLRSYGPISRAPLACLDSRGLEAYSAKMSFISQDERMLGALDLGVV